MNGAGDVAKKIAPLAKKLDDAAAPIIDGLVDAGKPILDVIKKVLDSVTNKDNKGDDDKPAKKTEKEDSATTEEVVTEEVTDESPVDPTPAKEE